MSETPDLPDFTRAQFDSGDPPECDLILKGGITSGVVYAYAILQIATKYRTFRDHGQAGRRARKADPHRAYVPLRAEQQFPDPS